MFKIPILILWVSFSVAAAQASDGTKPLPAKELKQYQACKHTADCMRVDNGCCDCANGGGTVSVHRKHEKKFRSHFKCENIMCTQMAGDCLFQKPVCKKGFCALGPQKKWQEKLPVPAQK